jgi:hypothetical protein
MSENYLIACLVAGLIGLIIGMYESRDMGIVAIFGNGVLLAFVVFCVWPIAVVLWVIHGYATLRDYASEAWHLITRA